MLNRLLLRQLQARTALALAPADVARALRQRMRLRGETDQAQYAAQALHDEDELQALIDLIVVPESWFMRDPDAFAALTVFVRDRLARQPQPVRILSVPCASGEEPYSIAIALLDAGIGPQDFAITGIDVSRRAIENAQRGIYTRNAFRARNSQELAFRERYFNASGNAYELKHEVRALVRFHRQSLFALDAPREEDRFDAVFCRNLLIYFDDATQQAAAARLHALLADDGLLFSGYAETASLCRHDFATAPFPRAFALRKRKAAESQKESAAVPADARMHASRLQRLLRVLDNAPAAPAPPPLKRVYPITPGELEQARLLANQGRFDEAAARYREYLRSHPDSSEAYFMLGLLHEQQHDNKAAEQHLRRALYFNPDHYDAICHLALLAEQQGDLARAAAYKRRAARVFGRRGAERMTR